MVGYETCRRINPPTIAATSTHASMAKADEVTSRMRISLNTVGDRARAAVVGFARGV
jgi:hypothetical protein